MPSPSFATTSLFLSSFMRKRHMQGTSQTTAAIRGLLHASGALSGTADKPAANVTARVDRASLGAVALSTASATAAVSSSGHLTVSAEVTPAAAAGSLALDAEASVPSGSDLNASLTVRDAGMAVLTELTGPSAPDWLEGRADVKLRAEGSVADPSVSGSASLSRARLQVPHPPYPLSACLSARNCAVAVHVCILPCWHENPSPSAEPWQWLSFFLAAFNSRLYTHVQLHKLRHIHAMRAVGCRCRI